MGNIGMADETIISAAISASGLQLGWLRDGLATKLGGPDNDPLERMQKDLGCEPSGKFVVFSGGQQRRLDLAQLLTRLAKARLLILDEPGENIDAGKFELIDKILAGRPKNCTVLLITHCKEMMTRADLIYLMERGQMVQCGTHDDLMKLKDGTYYRLQTSDQNTRLRSAGDCHNCRQADGGGERGWKEGGGAHKVQASDVQSITNSS